MLTEPIINAHSFHRNRLPHVRIVCNGELNAADVVVSKQVRETVLKELWNEAPAEVEALLHRVFILR